MTADLDAIRARLAAGEPRLVALIQGGRRWGFNSMHSLIAHAPADLAALCDEVEALRAAVQRVRDVALGEDSEEWVRRVGMSCLVSSASVLEALDGAS